MKKTSNKKCKEIKRKRRISTTRNWKTHAMVFDISSGVFETIDSALLYLDALRQEIKRLCTRYDCNCLFYGAVSISDEGAFVRTRYRSKLLSNAIERPPHIHAICIIDKQSFMKRKIREYINYTQAIKTYQKRTNRKGYYFDTIHKHKEMLNRLTYRVGQGFKVRTVQKCTPDFIQKYAGDFISTVEKVEKTMGGSKLVFPKYANIKLGTDKSLFDFSKNAKTQHNYTNNIEVWTGSTDKLDTANHTHNTNYLYNIIEKCEDSNENISIQSPNNVKQIKCNEIYNINILDVTQSKNLDLSDITHIDISPPSISYDIEAPYLDIF